MSFEGLSCQFEFLSHLEIRVSEWILSILLVLEWETCSRRVVGIRFGVFMWILGLKLKIELKFDFGQHLSFGARIEFLMISLVLGGDFSARMIFVIILGASIVF